MISKITGILAATGSNWALVDVHGVGYKVFTTPTNLYGLALGGACSYWTYLAVRDDALDLYGFADETELSFFNKLLTLPGVGPKSALGILAVASVETLLKAISDENPTYLTKMSGIGKKSAEKIVQGLKDKIEGFVVPDRSPRLQEESDLVEAITALGYSTNEARDAAKQVPESVVGIGERVKAVLKILNKQR